MNKPRCVFLDRDSIDCGDLVFSDLENVTNLETHASCRGEEVAEKAANAEIVIVNKVVLGKSQFEKLPQLKLICVIATGTNNIDLDAASQHGITVCNVRDYAAASVSQHVFMLVLALSTRFLEYQDDINAGAWQAQDQFCLLTHPMQELKGKTLGLVGYGHIARAVEAIALAFGMRVLISESINHGGPVREGRTDFNEIIKQSDVISLHCPLTDQTRNLISQRELQQMKPSAILINTARGGIINEADLLDALRGGEIAGAGIDCLVKEPPDPSDPMITAQLKQLIVTPHNAWGTLQARQRLLDGTVQNIRDFLADNITTRVNP